VNNSALIRPGWAYSCWLGLFLLAGVYPVSGSDTGTDPSQKYAWGENVGWVNAAATNPVITVHFDGTSGWLSGYAWGENIGWINFPTNGNGGVSIDTATGEFSGHAFDLPTESQWEYAGRAGTTTALNSGNNLTNTSADTSMDAVGRYQFNHPGGYSFSSSVDTNGGTATVGSYQANAWGLYDIHGNVFEWCLDWNGTYPGTVTDPVGASSAEGSSRVNRGGSWTHAANKLPGCLPLQRHPGLREHPHWPPGCLAPRSVVSSGRCVRSCRGPAERDPTGGRG
jgi:hypothetical protein